MKIDTSKLLRDTIIDLVMTLYPGSYLKEERVHIHGGSPRSEFAIFVNSNRISPTTSDPDKAWRYALDRILKEEDAKKYRIQLCVFEELITDEQGLPEYDIEEDLRNGGDIAMFRSSLVDNRVWLDCVFVQFPMTLTDASRVLAKLNERPSHSRLKYRLVEVI